MEVGLLASQDKVRIEHFVRQAEKWLLTEWNGLEDAMPLEAIGVTLELSEVYHKTDLLPSS